MSAKILVSVLAFLLLTSCTSFFKSRPTTKSVEFVTEPQEAKIYVNGNYMGETPISLKMESKKNYIIEIKKFGYKTKILDMTHYWIKTYQKKIAPSSVTMGRAHLKEHRVPLYEEIYKVIVKLEKK